MAAPQDEQSLDFTLDGSKWLHPAPESFNTIDAQKGKYSIEFHEVVTHEAFAAVLTLSNDSFKEISPEVAKIYTGMTYGAVPVKKYYLIRAAFHPSGTGDYEVRKQGDKLFVLYSCLGHAISPEKSALVVALDKQPSEIYIDINQTE
ncbi:MAG: hypothetical protein ACM3ZT_07890 [Bacillota bacterium]